MRLRPLNRHALLPVAALACLVLAGCGATPATSGDEAAVAASAEAADPGATDPDDGAVDGIHVSGEWEVVVRDPDGSVTSETTFHNDLVADGALTLARALGDPSDHVLGMRIEVKPGDVCSGSASPWCALSTDVEVDPTASTVVLTASREATGDATIRQVLTETEHGDTAVQRRDDFTSRVLETPVSVVEGQTVDITVTISFS